MVHFIETVAIKYTVAEEIVQKAMEVAKKRGVAAVVSVADPTMSLVAYGRADGATPHSAETSRRKANTAASTRRATGWMQGTFATELPLGTGNQLTNILGGVPITFEGRHVGGLGVAGGPPEIDAEIAHEVLEAIGADSTV